MERFLHFSAPQLRHNRARRPQSEMTLKDSLYRDCCQLTLEHQYAPFCLKPAAALFSVQATRIQRSPGLERMAPWLLDPRSALIFRRGRRTEWVELLSLHRSMEPVWWWKRGCFLLCLMEIPTDGTLSHQITFQRGSIYTTLLLIKHCLREFESNCLETSPSAAPRLKHTPCRKANPALRQESLHTVRGCRLPLRTLPHTAASTASAIQCLQLLRYTPAHPSLHQLVYGRRAGNTPVGGQPHTCLFSHSAFICQAAI